MSVRRSRNDGGGRAPLRVAAKRAQGTLRLIGAVTAIGALWLIVLPMMGRHSAVRATIERNEALGIDPSAKFYNDLPCMQACYERIERAHEEHREAFWLPSFTNRAELPPR